MTKITTIFQAATLSKTTVKNRALIRSVKDKVREYDRLVDECTDGVEILEDTLVEVMGDTSSSVTDVLKATKALKVAKENLDALNNMKDFYALPSDDQIDALLKADKG